MAFRVAAALMTMTAAVLADPGGEIPGLVLDVCAAPDGGAWLATASVHIDGSDAILLSRIDSEGEASFVDTLATVRDDAASCRLISIENGGCAAVAETGTGYTGVALRSYDQDGTLEWELIEDGFCYDSPYELLEIPGGGFLLLWDSWSEERGLWVMCVSPDGEAIWKTHAIPTAHPFYSSMCAAPDGGCAVTASTVTLVDENAAVMLNGEGSEVSGWSIEDLEVQGAFSSVGLWSTDAGFLSAWTLEPVAGSLDTLVMVELLPGGDTGRSWPFALDGLFGAELIDAVPEGGFVLCGTDSSLEGQKTWICTTDSSGAVSWSHRFTDGFTPVAMDISPDGLAVIAGDTATGSGAYGVCVGLGGEQLWTTR